LKNTWGQIGHFLSFLSLRPFGAVTGDADLKGISVRQGVGPTQLRVSFNTDDKLVELHLWFGGSGIVDLIWQIKYNSSSKTLHKQHRLHDF
jgi:hypothetical protein